MKHKIVNSGNDIGENHREDFRHCPHCENPLSPEEWECKATTLVMQPRFYRASAVAILSECPKCFRESWVHENYSSFGDYSEWPKAWIAAVKVQEKAVKLQAARDWCKGLCGRCAFLETAKIEHSTYRTCIKGMGPVATECDKFKELNIKKN